MKTINKMQVYAICAVFGLLAVAQSAIAGQATQTVYDSRVTIPDPLMTERERGNVLFLAEQAAKAKVWNSNDYADLDYSSCDASNFEILGIAHGSFTKPNRNQTVYLYIWCYPSHSDNLEGLVVFDNNKPVFHRIIHDHYRQIYSLKDINKNSLDEVVMLGFFTGQGSTEGWVNMAELQSTPRFLAQIDYQHLPEPYNDNCGAVESGSWESVVIRVLPSLNPTYTQQEIKGRCENERVATSIGPVGPLSLQIVLTDWLSGPLK